MSFRIVAGVWVLAAFVFVQAYQSLLITYVMAPIETPLINSAYDIAESNDINLLVKREGTIQAVLKVEISSLYIKVQKCKIPNLFPQNYNTTLFRKLVARLDNTGCILISECVSKIQPGSSYVVADVK